MVWLREGGRVEGGFRACLKTKYIRKKTCMVAVDGCARVLLGLSRKNTRPFRPVFVCYRYLLSLLYYHNFLY